MEEVILHVQKSFSTLILHLICQTVRKRKKTTKLYEYEFTGTGCLDIFHLKPTQTTSTIDNQKERQRQTAWVFKKKKHNVLQIVASKTMP